MTELQERSRKKKLQDDKASERKLIKVNRKVKLQNDRASGKIQNEESFRKDSE
jgi:hypothetical protein